MAKRYMAFILAALLLAGCAAPPVQTEPSSTVTIFTPPQTSSEPTQLPEETILPTEPLSQPTGTPKDVTISEVMPDNRKLTLGHTLDWIELYNREETPVSLEGYTLTDDPAASEQLSLDAFSIPANGYLTVTLPSDAPFGLSMAGETVYLLCNGEEIARLTYEGGTGGASFGEEGPLPYATPGFANTPEGYGAYGQSVALPELILSEVLASNSRYLSEQYEYYDLVEVRNNTDVPLSLGEYILSDSYELTNRYSFPDVQLQPGEHYVVFCSGREDLGEDHADFGIGAGETVYLARDGVRVDCLPLPADLQENESFGRSGSSNVYFKTPTPGYENSEGYLTGIPAPQADQPSGVYAEAVTVTLSGEGTIYYTLDGSRPTRASNVYKKPIKISDVTTIRAFCVKDGRSSPMAAFTYAVGAEHELPVVHVAIPQHFLTGEMGILNHIDMNYEYEGVLTLIEEGEEKFSVPFGFRLHGNDSRKHLKQNFQLRFRSEYGVGKLEYPLFDDRDIDEFDSLLLKGGSEDWYRAMVRDELATELANGTTALYTQAMKPVVLYLDGTYWGIYYFRERYSESYVASHLNVSEESVDMVFSSAAYDQIGSGEEFRALRQYVSSHDMTLPENYVYMTQRIDVVSLMDWYILRSFTGDKDIANIRRFRSTEHDGKWRWMFFDLDWGMTYTGDKPLSGIVERGADTALIQAVFRNETGRDAFLKRYAYLMDTVLNGEYVLSLMDSIIADYASEIQADRLRWGRTVAAWESAVEYLRGFFGEDARNKHVLQDIKDYFSLSDEEMGYYFGDRWQ